jgi:hypothetical protein
MSALSVIATDPARPVVQVQVQVHTAEEAILQGLQRTTTIIDEAHHAATAPAVMTTVAAVHHANTMAGTIALRAAVLAAPQMTDTVLNAHATAKTHTADHHHAVDRVSMKIRTRMVADTVMEVVDLRMMAHRLGVAELLLDVQLTKAVMIGLGTGEYAPSSFHPPSLPLLTLLMNFLECVCG